jgi:hypothetical protein
VTEHGQNTDNLREREILHDFHELPNLFRRGFFGGADRDRTDDLLNAIQALSQLSYGPTTGRLRDEFCVMNQK